MKDFYYEKYKMVVKKLQKTQINGKIYYIHELEDLIQLRCQYYTKKSIDLIKIPIMWFFICRNRKIYLQVHIKSQKTLTTQKILKKNPQSWKPEESYFLISKRYTALAGVTQLVAVLSCEPKGCGFNLHAGHLSRLWVQYPVRICMGGN